MSMQLFPDVISGDLEFTNIVATEASLGSLVQTFLPYTHGFGAGSYMGTNGLAWDAFSTSVTGAWFGGITQIQLTLSYHVHVDGANAITGLDQLVIYDSASGNYTASVVQTVTDMAGNVVATATSTPDGDWVNLLDFAMGYQDLNVSVTFMATLPPLAQSTDHVGISILSHGYTETPVAQLASLGDYVWEDADADGIQDGGEQGIGNVRVELLSASGAVLATTTTDSAGHYSFSYLLPGDYRVHFVAPPEYIISPQTAGAPGADSNPNAAGVTTLVNLTAGENDTTIDAGMYRLASLGDFVWLDSNQNGIQDEFLGGGFPAVTVTLIGAGKDDALGTGDDTTAVTTTDASGHYSFTKLMPGQYEVIFSLPNGYLFTLNGQGSDPALDSNANMITGSSGAITLVSGENDLSIDAGLFQAAKQSVPAALGNRVWLDADADGVQDDGEAGIADVTVKLIGAGDDKAFGTVDDLVLSTTTTDASGLYRFNGLLPGDYQVQFVAPGGYVPTQAGQGGDPTADSNAGAGGYAAPVTLASGQVDDTIDAGFYQLAGLGNRVWHDANANGVQDVGGWNRWRHGAPRGRQRHDGARHHHNGR